MAIEVTVGHNAAVSYVSATDATAILATLSGRTSWPAVAATQEAFLCQAAENINGVIFPWRPKLLIVDSLYYDQLLPWPWDSYEDPTDCGKLTVTNVWRTATGGDTTHFIDTALSALSYPNDYWNGGSVYVYQTTDRLAPEGELKAITDYVKSTGVVTTGAFSAAIGVGDSCLLIVPVPRWLKMATVFEAYDLVIDKKKFSERSQQGISSISDDTGSRTFRTPTPKDALCKEAWSQLVWQKPTIKVYRA